MFRPDKEPLTPNWRHLPIGYHGRAGTVVVGGTEIRRPQGQRKAGDFGRSQRLDFELELGFVIGKPSHLGEPVPVERALEHVFGAVLVNDWSARDIQAFEYVPLGPFLGKSFATSISPWVTTLDELRTTRGVEQEPEPLDHLRIENFAYDIALEIELNGEVISRTNARNLYWNVAQQIAHLTSNGASLRTGDLLATGTISGAGERERGSLIELTWNEGPFLQDGDEVVLRGEPLGEVQGRIVV
jgi:fumarylacetoacetase